MSWFSRLHREDISGHAARAFYEIGAHSKTTFDGYLLLKIPTHTRARVRR